MCLRGICGGSGLQQRCRRGHEGIRYRTTSAAKRRRSCAEVTRVCGGSKPGRPCVAPWLRRSTRKTFQGTSVRELSSAASPFVKVRLKTRQERDEGQAVQRC